MSKLNKKKLAGMSPNAGGKATKKDIKRIRKLAAKLAKKISGN